MKKIIIAWEKYRVSENSHKFLEKYLEKMKNFIDNNNIEIEVYDDIEERISEKFNDNINSSTKKEISDKIIVDIVNEIWEASEIFKDLVLEDIKKEKTKNFSFKKHFSNKNKQITRNSKKWMFFWVCYWLSQRFQIDPLWIRLLFILWIFFGWVSIIIYIALIFLLPNKKNNNNNEDIIDEFQDVTNDLIKNLKTATKKIKNENKKNFSKQSSDWIKNEKEEYVNNYNDNRNSNFIVRFFISIFDFIKAVFIFIFIFIKQSIILAFWLTKKWLIIAFHSSRIGVSILILIIWIPILLAFLFLSWFTFTDFVFDNQSLFLNIHLFFKIWLVWIISSFAFITIWISLKLLRWKLLSNTLLLSWIILLFFFIFVWSVGFFNTLEKYTNTYTKTEIFEFDNKEVVLDNFKVFWTNNNYFINWINWIEKVDFRVANWDKLKMEVKSFINTKNKQEADKIFSKLKKIEPKISPSLHFWIENKDTFTWIVPFSFLRREITFYIPKNINFQVWTIKKANINYVSNLYYRNKENIFRANWLHRECREKSLKFLQEKNWFLCE